MNTADLFTYTISSRSATVLVFGIVAMTTSLSQQCMAQVSKTPDPPFLSEQKGIELFSIPNGEIIISHYDLKSSLIAENDQDQATFLSTEQLASFVARSPTYSITLKGLTTLWTKRYVTPSGERYLRAVVACCNLGAQQSRVISKILDDRWPAVQQHIKMTARSTPPPSIAPPRPDTLTPERVER